ncbi:hypothetical protein [Niabella ginsengisoli]|uniref:Quinol oxidase subunit 4 n=1 Tax=Niabella ginsengisoli TaxID=522298 RepID=A0ABS9SE88_9BACT|nr:hypothetical protein [Niabella ginsengisoli]MCH5596677.1 hypothetical protein [Niabella ginsengisoli]
MKTSITKMLSLAVVVIALIGLFSSCVHPHYHRTPGYSQRGHVPPGHAKKYYGTKSAKPFAPGQQKKYRGRR